MSKVVVNVLKSKNFFSKSKHLHDYSFHIGYARVEVVQEYQYLGVANGSLRQAVSTLADQAKTSLFLLECKSRFLHIPSPLIMCHLFDSLVLSWSMVVNWGDFIRLMNLSSYTGNFANLCLSQPPSHWQFLVNFGDSHCKYDENCL